MPALPRGGQTFSASSRALRQSVLELTSSVRVKPDASRRGIDVSAARKQGFRSLEEVERAVLEPGETISFIGKKPDVTTQQFYEVTPRLDQIARQVAELAARPRLEPPSRGSYSSAS